MNAPIISPIWFYMMDVTGTVDFFLWCGNGRDSNMFYSTLCK